MLHTQLAAAQVFPAAILRQHILEGLVLDAVGVAGEEEEGVLRLEDGVGLVGKTGNVFLELPDFFLGAMAPAGGIGEQAIELEALVVAVDQKALHVFLDPLDAFGLRSAGVLLAPLQGALGAVDVVDLGAGAGHGEARGAGVAEEVGDLGGAAEFGFEFKDAGLEPLPHGELLEEDAAVAEGGELEA